MGKSLESFNNVRRKNMSVIITNQFFVEIADAIYDIAIYWYVYNQTGSALSAAFVTAITFLTQILIGPFMGVVADRLEPKKGMRFGLLVMMGVGIVLSIVYMYWVDFIIIIIYLTIIIHNVSMVFVGPAKNKLLTRIVHKRDIVSISGYISSAANGAQLIGNAVSGFIIASIGFVGVMLTHSALYLLASLMLMILVDIARSTKNETIEKNEYDEEEKSKFIDELKEGYKVLRANRSLFKLVMFSVVLNVSTVVMPLLIVLVTVQYNGGATEFGLFNTATVIASLLMGLIINFINQLLKPGHIFTITLAVSGIALIVMSISSNIYIGMLIFFIYSAMESIQRIIFNVFFITLVNEEFRGRVFTISMSLSVVTIPLFAIIGGYLTDVLSVNYIYIFAGIWIFLCSIYPLMDKDIRNIEKLG